MADPQHNSSPTRVADPGVGPVVRPQPIGTFALPLGYLLIPAGDDTEDARTEMLAGRLPDVWPAALRAHELAALGRRDEAVSALTAQDRAEDPVTRYNLFVLDPDSEDPDSLRAALGEFGVLVDIVLFALGRTDIEPESNCATGELLAAVCATQAAGALDRGDPHAAIELLDRAIEAAENVSDALTGVMVGAAAAVCRDVADPSARSRLQRAVRLLDGAHGLHVTRAEIHLCLASLLHEQADANPQQLSAAIPHYHSVLQLIVSSDAPTVWADAHTGLAAAYLTMPMVEASGQLRRGVAAQSLRSALTVYTREDYPDQWASIQLNLANSMVYTPSNHHADNLVDAVEIYEAVLQTRDRHTDPHGRARVLANQGNTLAHLGAFDEAKAKLYEARFLFEELGDNDSVRTVRGVLDEIARSKVLAATDGSGIA